MQTNTHRLAFAFNSRLPLLLVLSKRDIVVLYRIIQSASASAVIHSRAVKAVYDGIKIDGFVSNSIIEQYVMKSDSSSGIRLIADHHPLSVHN